MGGNTPRNGIRNDSEVDHQLFSTNHLLHRHERLLLRQCQLTPRLPERLNLRPGRIVIATLRDQPAQRGQMLMHGGEGILREGGIEVLQRFPERLPERAGFTRVYPLKQVSEAALRRSNVIRQGEKTGIGAGFFIGLLQPHGEDFRIFTGLVAR